jgi:hypothetical protein
VTLKNTFDTLEDVSSLKREPEEQTVVLDAGVSLLMTRFPISHSASIVLDETEVAYPEPATCKILLVKSARLLRIEAPLYENGEFELSLSKSWVSKRGKSTPKPEGILIRNTELEIHVVDSQEERSKLAVSDIRLDVKIPIALIGCEPVDAAVVRNTSKELLKIAPEYTGIESKGSASVLIEILPPVVAEPVKSPEIVNKTVEFDSMLVEVLIRINDGKRFACPERPEMESTALPTKNDSGNEIQMRELLNNAPPTEVEKATVHLTAAILLEMRSVAAMENTTEETLSPILPDAPLEGTRSAEVETAIPGKPPFAGPKVNPENVIVIVEEAKTVTLVVVTTRNVSVRNSILPSISPSITTIGMGDVAKKFAGYSSVMLLPG